MCRAPLPAGSTSVRSRRHSRRHTAAVSCALFLFVACHLCFLQGVPLVRQDDKPELAPGGQSGSENTKLCDSLANSNEQELHIVHLQTFHGAFLSVTWGESGGGPNLTADEACCPPDTRFSLQEWRGLKVLYSVTLGLVLGVRDGKPILGMLPEEAGDGERGVTSKMPSGVQLADDEVCDVVEDMFASRSVSLRFGRDSQVLLFASDSRLLIGPSAAGNLDSVLLVVDEQLLKHLEHLNTEGYAVVQVLSEEEARDARDTLDRVVSFGVEHGLLYSNGYQVRVPDVATHDSLFSELLVHPKVLFLARSYLGRSARAATWSSNTLLPNMDHPVLGWHADYPYHDIEPGTWPDQPLGVQVLWMLDHFTNNNGGTMFFPGSHLALNPPVFDDFSEPEGAQILNAPAGSVLIAHSAWWHRQTANTSPHPRHALLACFTRGYVVPKADMEGQYLAVSGSSSFWDSLDVRQQEELRHVMLGPHGRGLRGVHV